MTLVFAAVMQTFMGARKAQGMAVATENLKHEGQKAMHHMMLELGQARRLLASQITDPSTEDIGRAYFEAIDDFQGNTSPLPAASMVFPRTYQDGKFHLLGALSDGRMPYESFGNTLVFVKRDGEIAISGLTVKFGATLMDKTLTAEKPFRVSVYRFVAYYLGTRDLPPNAPPINGGGTQTLVLCRFESQPYLEKSEAFQFLSLLPTATEKQEAWNTKLNQTSAGEAIAGAWDANETNPDLAFYKYSQDTDDMVNIPGYVRGKQSRPLTQFTGAPYAIGTVSFNAGSRYPDFKVAGTRDGEPSFVVPAFALDPNAVTPPSAPYGFEVGIAGPNSGRSVLLRLALAARISAGNHLYGHIHQQSVQVFDN
ncbi:MAG: hypothetical protein ACLGIN_13070 [Candidatus Sericytochromatia bacterium]